MLFSSTTVSNGSCDAVVVATGMTTEIGKIQARTSAARRQPLDCCGVFPDAMPASQVGQGINDTSGLGSNLTTGGSAACQQVL